MMMQNMFWNRQWVTVLLVTLLSITFVTACGPIKQDYDPMQHKTLSVDGLNINYFESEGKGKGTCFFVKLPL